MTIDEFLLQQIAVDQQQLDGARISEGPEWWMPDHWTREHAEADLNAKRQIVADCAHAMRKREGTHAAELARDILWHLASGYADRPDYDPAWRPGHV